MKNRALNIAVFLFALWCMALQYAQAQVEMQKRDAEQTITLSIDAMTYLSETEDKSRVDVYVQIPNSEMRFIKDGDSFVARYDVTVNFQIQDQTMLSVNWLRERRVEDFALTASSRHSDLSVKSIDIPPGKYDILIQVTDLESKKSAVAKRTLLVLDLRKDAMSVSDIMLLNRMSVDGQQRNIVPNVGGTFTKITEGFSVFFEIYAKNPISTATFNYKIVNMKKAEVQARTQTEQVNGTKAQVFFKLDSLNLQLGTYFIVIDAIALDENGDTLKANSSRNFSVRSTDLPFTVKNIDKAVDQMMYIALDSDLRYIRNAEDPEEKRRRFLDFWAKRDPDPSTSRNELLEEYYQRVEYANATFTHHLEGWKSDMGMVYITFGPPESVERRPFEAGMKPFEIWYYYQQGRRFDFIDETGFGDYRLVYPTRDLWGRVR
ncbi:MAG: GWxTD domain-containing protein [bacterium]